LKRRARTRERLSTIMNRWILRSDKNVKSEPDREETRGLLEYSTSLAIALRLQDALKNGEPFSLVRLGDGENTIFQYPNFCSLHRIQYVVSRALDGDSFKKRDLKRFKKDLVQAIESSDVVGIYDSSHPSILARIYSEHLEGIQFKDNASFCDPRIHFYLQQSGHLESLIRMSHKVTLITGRNIIEKFKEVFPNLEVSQILLPSERTFRLSVEGDRGLHYPDCFETIRNRIKGGKGHLVLVGAGFLGKTYCEWARQQGSVAIDIGSVFDYWADTPTREGYQTVRNGSLSLERPSFRKSMSLGAAPIGESASTTTYLGTASISQSPNNFVNCFSHSALKSALKQMNIRAKNRIDKDKYRTIAAIYIWIKHFEIDNIYCLGEQELNSYMPKDYCLEEAAKINLCGPDMINDKDYAVLIAWPIKDIHESQLNDLVKALEQKPRNIFFCDYRVYELIKDRVRLLDYIEHDLKLNTVNVWGSAGFLQLK